MSLVYPQISENKTAASLRFSDISDALSMSNSDIDQLIDSNVRDIAV